MFEACMMQSVIFTALMIAVVVAGIILLFSICSREGISSANRRTVAVRTVVPEPELKCKKRRKRGSGVSGSSGGAQSSSEDDDTASTDTDTRSRKHHHSKSGSGWSGSSGGAASDGDTVVVPRPTRIKHCKKQQSSGWLWFVLVLVFAGLIGAAVYIVFFRNTLPRGVVSYMHVPVASPASTASACAGSACRLPGVRSSSILSKVETRVEPLPPPIVDAGRLRAAMLPVLRSRA